MRTVTINTEGPAIITQEWVFQVPDDLIRLPTDPDEAFEFLNNHRVPSTTTITSHRADEPTAFAMDLTELR